MVCIDEEPTGFYGASMAHLSWWQDNYGNRCAIKGPEYTEWLDEPLQFEGYSDSGDSRWVGTWYNEETRQTELGNLGKKTQYRYREKNILYDENWSEWSSFDENPVVENETMQVETRTLYRYKIYE